MNGNFKFKNLKSVNFRCVNFCVPIKAAKTPKHTIGAKSCVGMTARPKGLFGGTGLGVFDLAAFPNIGGTIKHIHNAKFGVNGVSVMGVVVVTESAVKFVSLKTLLVHDMDYRGYTCFANGVSGGKEYCFAGCADGVFAFTENLDVRRVAVECVPIALKVVCNRLFVLDSDRAKIYFSPEFEMLDFSDAEFAGCVRPNAALGKIIGLEEYDGRLLVVHEYGFSILESDFDPFRFRIRTLKHCFERIIEGSAKTIGDAVFFLTAAGMCRIVNGKIQLLDINLGTGAIAGAAGTSGGAGAAAKCAAVADSGKYYLACGGEVLIIERFYDCHTKFACPENVVQFERIAAAEGGQRVGAVLASGQKIYQLGQAAAGGQGGMGGFGTAGGRWESEWFALSYASGVQYVKQILIDTKYAVKITLNGTNGAQVLAVGGAAGIQHINLNFKGEIFQIVLEAAGAVEIGALTVTVGYGNAG